MKTEQSGAKGRLPAVSVERHKTETGRPESQVLRKDKSAAYSQKPKSIELKEPIQKPLESVQKMIGENIQWREMRFYRHEADGKYYVDIIDKETGEVLRTVPEPEFVKVATEFKHLTGMNLDING